jgi:hypothetical protein
MVTNELKFKTNPEDLKARSFYDSLDKNSSDDYRFRPDVIGKPGKNGSFFP